MLRSFLALSCAAALSVCSVAASADPIEADQGNVVPLCGMLKRETHLGPPGFGETPELDARRSVWVLVLPKPADFRHKPDMRGVEEEPLRKLQLGVGPGGSINRVSGRLSSLMAQPVLITGKLWTASSEGDTTPVVVQMTRVDRMRSPDDCMNL